MLDRARGEVVQGLDGPYYIVPLSAVADMNLLTKYDVPGKFRAQGAKVARRHIIEDALAIAADAFEAAGAMLPIAYDESSLLIQAYPTLNKLAVVVGRSVAGEARYVTRIYDLPHAAIRQLLDNADIKHHEDDHATAPIQHIN